MKFKAEITTIAGAFGLDPLLVAGLISIESDFNPWAWNPEPRYQYLWNVRTHAPFRTLTAAEIDCESPPRDFKAVVGDPDQEWWGQSASWGLMQLMGAVAREHGFADPYLPALCDPNMGLGFGCQHLAALLSWARGNVDQALAAYNGGRGGNSKPPFRNQEYATKVITARSILKGESVA